jgi:hypothetical protein
VAEYAIVSYLSRRFSLSVMTERRAEPLRDFCSSIGISYDTGFRAYKAGGLRIIRVGRRILVPRDEIDRVLREGLRGRTPVSEDTTQKR